LTIRHNLAGHRFECPEAGLLSTLDYEIDGKTAIFTHTFVPPAMRGRGIAEALVRAALAWTRQEGLQVESRCSYVSRFLDLHPEFQPLRLPRG